MSSINEFTYCTLEKIFKIVAGLGLPLILTAWLAVLFLVIYLSFILKRYQSRKKIMPAIMVGGISLTAHMTDYFGTLGITPDLAIEANPIWRVVVENLGLRIALLYGLSGKIFLSILSFQFFLYYLTKRKECIPVQHAGFFDFWRRFGHEDSSPNSVSWLNIKVFFSFIFSLIGPFCFYVALLNNIKTESFYYKLPAMPIALAIYMIALVVIFLFGNYYSLNNARVKNDRCLT